MTWLADAWRVFWFAPSRPTNLGVVRLIVYAAILYFYGGRDFGAWAEVPDLFWHPIRVFGLVHLVVFPAEVLRALTAVWAVALASSSIGLFTRASTVTSFVLGLYLLGLPHNFGKVHHGDALTVLVMGVLAVSRCGDGWSVDRLVTLARRGAPAEAGRPRYSGEYTWPIKLMWVLMTLVFVAAGTAKLRRSGLQWITSDNMTNMLINHHYSHHPPVRWGLYLAQHRVVAMALAALTIVAETAAPLALFSRRLRAVLIPSLFVMQVGIWLTMGILFRDFLLLYLVWVPWDRVGDWLSSRWARRPTATLLYDGSCRLCRGTISVIGALDLLRRVRSLDVHTDWPRIADQLPSLTQHACLAEMHVVSPDGRVWLGFDAYRALAWWIPLGWLALPVLYLPGVRPLGRRIYGRIAASRACPIDASPRPTVRSLQPETRPAEVTTEP
jgi:predicted DCC family thiol-disulfide oxidoreductase YuxK